MPKFNSGNILTQCKANIASKEEVKTMQSPWDSLDANCKKFIPKLLLCVLQKEQDSTLRDEAMDILLQNFSMPNEDKYLKGAFSNEAIELWKCLFRCKKDFVVKDAFRLLMCLFDTHKDALFAQMGPSDAFDEVMRLWWNPKFTSDVGALLKLFIELGSREEVSYMFENFEILETLCQVARAKADKNHNYIVMEDIEYQLLDMFRSKMIIHYRQGYLLWLQVTTDYGLH